MTEPILIVVLTAELAGLMTVVVLWLRMRERDAVRKHERERQRDSQSLEHIETWAGRVVDWRLTSGCVPRQGKHLPLTHLDRTLDLFLNIQEYGGSASKMAQTVQHGLPECIQNLTDDIAAFANCLNERKLQIAEKLSGAPPVATGFDKDFPINEVILDALDAKMTLSAGKVLEKVADIKARGTD